MGIDSRMSTSNLNKINSFTNKTISNNQYNQQNQNINTVKLYNNSNSQNSTTITPTSENINEYKHNLKKQGINEKDIDRIINNQITLEDLLKEIESEEDNTRRKALANANILTELGVEETNLDEVIKQKKDELKKLARQLGIDENDLAGSIAKTSIESMFSAILTKDGNRDRKEYLAQIEKLGAEIEDLESLNNSINFYMDYTDKYSHMKDFNEKNQGSQEAKSRIETMLTTSVNQNDINAYINLATRDDELDFLNYCINNPDDVKVNIKSFDNVKSDHNFLNLYKECGTVMEDTEKKIFNYLYNTDKDKAYEYLKLMADEMDSRAKAKKTEEDKEYAKLHPYMASFTSVITRPNEGIHSAIYTAKTKMNGDKLRQTGIHSHGDAYRAGVTEKIQKYYEDKKAKYLEKYLSKGYSQQEAEKLANDKAQKNAEMYSFLYGTGMSMADSTYLALLTGGMTPNLIDASKGTKVLYGLIGAEMSAMRMGSTAYMSTLSSALERGLSDDDAILLATSSGLAETAMEYLSLNNLLNLENITGDAIENITKKILTSGTKGGKIFAPILKVGLSGLSQGTFEGFEEVSTSLINSVFEDRIAGSKSEFNLAMKEYMDLGYSSEEAYKYAFNDSLNQLKMDFLGGFISGGVMGGGKVTIDTIVGGETNNSSSAESIMQKYKEGNQSTLDMSELAENNLTTLQKYKGALESLLKNPIDLKNVAMDKISSIRKSVTDIMNGDKVNTIKETIKATFGNNKGKIDLSKLFSKKTNYAEQVQNLSEKYSYAGISARNPAFINGFNGKLINWDNTYSQISYVLSKQLSKHRDLGVDSAITALLNYGYNAETSTTTNEGNAKSIIKQIPQECVIKYVKDFRGLELLQQAMTEKYGDSGTAKFNEYLQTGNSELLSFDKSLKSLAEDMLPSIRNAYSQIINGNSVSTDMNINTSTVNSNVGNSSDSLNQVYDVMKNKYGEENAQLALEKYIETGNENLITRDGNARNIIKTLSLDSIKQFLATGLGNNKGMIDLSKLTGIFSKKTRVDNQINQSLNEDAFSINNSINSINKNLSIDDSNINAAISGNISMNQFVDTIAQKYNYSEQLTSTLKKISPVIKEYFGADGNNIFKALSDYEICIDGQSTNKNVEPLPDSAFGGTTVNPTYVDGNVVLEKLIHFKKDFNLNDEKSLTSLVHELCHAVKTKTKVTADGVINYKSGLDKETFRIDPNTGKEIMIEKNSLTALEEALNSIAEADIMTKLTGKHYQTTDSSYSNITLFARILTYHADIKQALLDSQFNDNNSLNKLIGEDTANKIINGFNKELEYMNLGPVEGQKILDTEIKPFRSEFSNFLSNFINNRNVTDGVLLESKRNQLERLLNIADPSENIKSKILELQNDIYGDNIKKFSQLFDKSVSEMRNYFGDAGENVTALLKSGKTTNQILDMLTGDEKIKFYSFLNDTIEGRYLSRLTREELFCFGLYSGENFQILNDGLRKDDMDNYISGVGLDYITANIDSSLEKADPLQEDLQLYRGVSKTAFTGYSKEYAELFKGIDLNNINEVYAVLKTLEGRNLGDKAYMSTSPAYNTSFAKKENKPIVLDIVAKKGTKPGAYINQISDFYNKENEFLLKRDTNLRILEVLKPAIDVNGNEKIVVRCEIVEDGGLSTVKHEKIETNENQNFNSTIPKQPISLDTIISYDNGIGNTKTISYQQILDFVNNEVDVDGRLINTNYTDPSNYFYQNETTPNEVAMAMVKALSQYEITDADLVLKYKKYIMEYYSSLSNDAIQYDDWIHTGLIEELSSMYGKKEIFKTPEQIYQIIKESVNFVDSLVYNQILNLGERTPGSNDGAKSYINIDILKSDSKLTENLEVKSKNKLSYEELRTMLVKDAIFHESLHLLSTSRDLSKTGFGLMNSTVRDGFNESVTEYLTMIRPQSLYNEVGESLCGYQEGVNIVAGLVNSNIIRLGELGFDYFHNAVDSLEGMLRSSLRRARIDVSEFHKLFNTITLSDNFGARNRSKANLMKMLQLTEGNLRVKGR